MKKRWVIVSATFMLAIGFALGYAIGFIRGETIYLWIFRLLPDDISFFDAIVGIATVIIAGIAIGQSSKANKTNERIAYVEAASLTFAHTPKIAVKNVSFRYINKPARKYKNNNKLGQVLVNRLCKEKPLLRYIMVTVDLDVLSGVISFVEVENVIISLSNKKLRSGRYIPSKFEFVQVESNTAFSPVVTRPNGNITFNVSLVATKDNLHKIENMQMHGIQGFIKLDIKLLSHMRIMSKYECGVYLEPSNNKEIGELVTSTNKPPYSYATEEPKLLNKNGDDVEI